MNTLVNISAKFLMQKKIPASVENLLQPSTGTCFGVRENIQAFSSKFIFVLLLFHIYFSDSITFVLKKGNNIRVAFPFV